VSPAPAPQTWVVDVVTRDRARLFAVIADTLALSGLDVLHAEAFTTQSGIALDTFTVTSATLAPVEPAAWSAFERSLNAVIAGRLDLELRLAERRRHYERRTAGTGPVDVRVGAQAAFTTAVTVRAPDRVGLLHDLALVFSAEELDIRHAVITTRSGVAEDTFDVVDAQGAPLRPATLDARLIPLLQAAARG